MKLGTEAGPEIEMLANGVRATYRATQAVSRKSIVATGQLGVAIDVEMSFAPLIFSGGNAIALDPRCLVVDERTKEIVYNPRTRSHLAPWVMDWLKDNPQWPDDLIKATG